MVCLKDYVLDIIFPRRCLGCNILLGKERPSYVCRRCLKTITFKNDFACAFCKSPVKAGKTCVYCIKTHYLDQLLVVTSYDNPLVEKILKTIKYHFVKSLTDDTANLMTEYLKKKVAKLIDAEFAAVIPIPLHRSRLNWRGFNQAEIMAKKIAMFFDWPLITDALKRVRANKPQTEMPDRDSRIQNTQNLFKISPIYQSSTPIDYPQVGQIPIGKAVIMGKTILLIDDISTTGSTLNDCARALKGAGAKEVIGFVFARNKLDKHI